MNLFELFIKIGVDDQASDKISGLSSKLGSGLATAAKIGTAAITAAAAGITALTTAAVNNYAEYEQLIGGAELLFGNAFDFVQEKASEAYKNVQMSQSEYLQQVNGFATGLKTALGGNAQAAAELADRIITAEADIVAATGNSQEAVSNAFNGIMKSNYTMLDNLQLGITPTKEGFQEVIDIVNKWNAEQGKATDYQIDNLADAQSALLDYIEMQGLSGYASMEAANTISGSVASMKSAWTNLLTGIADENQDLDALIGNFVDSVATAGENIIPRVERILGGIGSAITKLAPVISEAVPNLVTNVLPTLLDAGVRLIDGLLQGLTTALPALAESAIDVVLQIVDALTNPDTLNNLIDAAIKIIASLADGLIKAIPKIVAAIPTIIKSLIQAIIGAIPVIVETLFTSLPQILQAIVSVLGELPVLIWDILTHVLGELGKWIVSLGAAALEAGSKFISNIGTFFKELPGNIWNWLVSAFVNLTKWGMDMQAKAMETGKNFLDSIGTFFKELPGNVWNWLVDTFTKLTQWGVNMQMKAIETGSNFLNSIVNFFKELPGNIWDWLVSTFTKITQWGMDMRDKAMEVGGNFINSIVNFVKELPGKIWTWLTETISKIGTFISDMATKIKTEVPKVINNFIDFFKQLPGKILGIGKNIVDGLWNGIKNAWSSLTSKVSGLFGNLVSGIKKGLGIASPSKVFAAIGGYMAEGLGEGWEDEFGAVRDDIDKSLTFDDPSMGINASVRKIGSEVAGAAYGGTSIGNITINIDGAKYSDENSLAEAIAESLQNMTDRRSAVYA